MDIYVTLHTTAAKYTFLSAQGTLSKIDDDILDYKTNFTKFKGLEIIKYVF